MSLWRQLSRGLRVLIHRDTADRDTADEVRHYLDQAAAAHRARGLSAGDAERAARLELGGETGVREQVRSYGWENTIETLLGDLRYAGRRLRASPAFTATAVLTLALGVGGTTAIFSAVNPILFEPLPYPQAERLVALTELHRDGTGFPAGGTFGMYREVLQRGRSFDAVAVAKPWQPTLVGSAEPERLDAQRVSEQYFRVLGMSPIVGRDFSASEDRLNGPKVAIISDGLWRRHFASDRAIVGQHVTLNGDPYLIIGVMPPTFENVLAPSAELWSPLQYDMSQGNAWGHHLTTIARLEPGVTVAQAARDFSSLGRAVLQEVRPETYDLLTQFTATSMQADLMRGVRRALLAILGAVILVLVIACVNVTNLLLARGAYRRAEFALRAALGAGHKRIVRQLLTESLLLSALGGIVGIAIAAVGVRALVALSPVGLPRLGAIRVDVSVLLFGLALTTVCGLVFGAWPALQAARSDPQRELQHGSRRTAGGHRGARGALVVAEVALALVLLVGSGLLLRSLQRLFAVSSGFDGAGVLTMQVRVSGHRFDADTTTFRFFNRALEAVRRVPGVIAAALTSQLPLSGDRDEYGVHFEETPTRRAETYGAFRYAVSPGYLETMRIPLRRGRVFDEHDGIDAPRVAVISASLARARFGDTDPIGQRLRIGPPNAPVYSIVGVVGDVRQLSLALNESDAVYVPATQWFFADNAMSLVVRTRGPAASMTPSIRAAVWSVDKDQPVVRVATMDDVLAASASERRFALVLFEAFGLAALVLAAAGIYGVLAGSVAERTREIGVRAALGASRRSIVGLVLRNGLTLTGAGITLGFAAAVVASKAIVAMLFGVSRLDPATYAGVIALLVIVAAIACAVPAMRASRLDPASTLRAD